MLRFEVPAETGAGSEIRWIGTGPRVAGKDRISSPRSDSSYESVVDFVRVVRVETTAHDRDTHKAVPGPIGRSVLYDADKSVTGGSWAY